MAGNDHPRRIIRGFLPLDVCKELEFIHKSNCTVGYRPNVFSTTLSHLIATNSSHLIMPFVSLRERIKEEVERAFGCEFELFVEFTGIISWTKGASIGCHSDDNRPYLKQRDFAAVCYLNSYREHFKGGLFHFQNGEPETIVPMAGDVIMYTADSRNVHSVDEITDGERLTLTLWFTRDANHNEDVKLLSHLSQSGLPCLHDELASLIPQPGSTNMYWFSSQPSSNQQENFDIRFARLALLGYNILPSEDERRLCESASLDDPLEILMEPLHLIRGENLLDTKFANILHALQVVQFYNWKREVPGELDFNCNIIPVSPLSKSQMQGAQRARDVLLNDGNQAERVFVYPSCGTSIQHLFDEVSFSNSLIKWEAYSRRLQKHLQESIPQWRNHQSIFAIPSVVKEKGRTRVFDRSKQRRIPTMTTIVATTEEDPSLAVVRFVSDLTWADAGAEVAEQEVAKLCREVEEYLVVRKWYELASLIVTSADIVFSKVGEKDLECIYTVICNLVSKSESPEEILDIAKLISGKVAQQPTDKPSLRLKILFNLYNLLDDGYARYYVYMKALQLAVSGKVTEHVIPSFKKIDEFLKEWNIGIEDQRELFLTISNISRESRSNAKDSFNFLTKYLVTFSSENADDLIQAKDVAVQAIIEFIKTPDMFQCDLLDMPAVAQLEKDTKHSSIYQLLKIFLTERLDAYLEFQAANADLLNTFGLVHEDCVAKMKLTSLTDLAYESHQIPYALIKETLKINDDEVESWVFKAVTAKLLKCKMDQINQLVIVSYCSERVFGPQQWANLRTRLATWRGNIANVINNIQSNKLTEDVNQVAAQNGTVRS